LGLTKDECVVGLKRLFCIRKMMIGEEGNMIVLDMSDKRPIYEQIVDTYKNQIALGILKPDEKLPSVRQLAVEMSINPNTIQKAYAELERSGFIYTVKGRGNFAADISDMLPIRQKKYYENLDSVLSQAERFSLKGEEVIEHVKTYFIK